MPIAFTCSCGKVMKAKEAFAGRKIKCPQCDTLVRIPELESEEPATAPPSSLLAGPPLAKPVAPPLAQPAGQPTFFLEDDENGESTPAPVKPVARPIVLREHPETTQRHSPAAVHVWVDQSLVQQPTPWLPGDEARFQQGIKPPREGISGLEKGVVGLLLFVGAGATVGLLLMAK